MDLAATARVARFVRGAETMEKTGTEGPPGALARALDAAGSAALLGLLDGNDAVELEDAEVRIRVERATGGARVVTRWATGEHVEETVAAAPIPPEKLASALHDPSRTLHLRDGAWWDGRPTGPADAIVPAITPENLGDPGFRSAHGVRCNYVAGAMAGGIASPALVVAMGRAGYLGYFGAGGLDADAVRKGVRAIKAELGDAPAGFNLLHNPVEPALEEATVDLYLEHGCHEVDASAYMGLTPAVVRFRLSGIREEEGRIVTPNRVSAKVSRPEVAEHFLKPAPAKMVEALVAKGALTARQAELARHVPMAEDITAEADSGGHTDRRPLPVLIPIFRRLRDRIAAEHGYVARPRIGAAGGIGDPATVAAAFTLGADYVMTGSVNQATPEAATSDAVKAMLLEAGYADVTMGPAPDMFEIGAQVQVLARGTMYAQRAQKLRDLYQSCGSLDEIPAAEREKIEKQIFRRSLDEVWRETEMYWAARDPRELERARADGRHRMALCFRWYLGLTSRWARIGDDARKRDYQVWCGPAMGLFNDWVRGTRLEPLAARSVVAVADALMVGACAALRVRTAADAGVPLPADAWRILPHAA